MGAPAGAALREGEAELVAYLHPNQLGDPLGAARGALDRLLLQWSEDLEGVLLAHEGAALVPEPGRVLGTLPYVRAGVSARLQVFAPEVGDTLVGEVTKLGGDYIALLVLGIFPAVVPLKNIREGFQQEQEGTPEACWTCAGAEGGLPHRVSVGSMVRFSVSQCAPRLLRRTSKN